MVAHGADQLELLIRLERVGEEELQKALVADLVDQVAARGEPLVERPLAFGGQAVLAPPASAAGIGLALDEAGLLQARELGVDLAVAGCPEVADRAIDDPLDVVAAPWLERDQAKYCPGDR